MPLRCSIPSPRATALLCALTATVATAQTNPPVAPVKDVTDTYFGVAISDPYRYMEDMKDPEVVAWMKAQADYTHVVLDRIPQRAVLLSEIQKYSDAAPSRTFGIQVNGNHIHDDKGTSE